MGEGEGKKGETRETRGQSVTVHLFLCNTHQEAGVQEWCRVRRFALFADNGFFVIFPLDVKRGRIRTKGSLFL